MKAFGRLGICCLGLLFGLLLNLLWNASTSQAAEGPSLIEIGAGVAAPSGVPSELEALFHVELVAGSSVPRNAYFIWARINADASFAPSALDALTSQGGTLAPSYVDFRFETLTYQKGFSEKYWSVSLATAELTRNVALQNDLSARVTFVGVRGSGGAEFSEKISFFIRGALDLIGLGLSRQGATDPAPGSKDVGPTMGFSAEAGVRLFKRVRISLGGDIDALWADPVREVVGRKCDFFYDEWGYEVRECYDKFETNYQKRHLYTSAHAKFAVELGKSLGLFGKASYQIYSVDDRDQPGQSSSESGLIFLMGVSGRW